MKGLERFVWLLIRYTKQSVDRAVDNILGEFVRRTDELIARSNERDF